MFAKCPNHNLVRISRMRKSCPDCGAKLSRPTSRELNNLADNAMDRMRSARALIDCYGGEFREEMKMAAFMAIVEGKHMKAFEIKNMLKN